MNQKWGGGSSAAPKQLTPELAAIYEQTHPFAAMESKHGDAWGQGANHCKKLAQLASHRDRQALAPPLG